MAEGGRVGGLSVQPFHPAGRRGHPHGQGRGGEGDLRHQQGPVLHTIVLNVEASFKVRNIKANKEIA